MVEKKRDKKYGCSKCDKKFIWPSDLKRHELTHSRKKSVALSDLRVTKKAHETELSCTQCDKTFAFPSDLEKHQISHSNKEDATIGEIFKPRPVMQNIFEGESKAAISCSECGKKFSFPNTLKTHIMECHVNPRLAGKKSDDVVLEPLKSLDITVVKSTINSPAGADKTSQSKSTVSNPKRSTGVNEDVSIVGALTAIGDSPSRNKARLNCMTNTFMKSIFAGGRNKPEASVPKKRSTRLVIPGQASPVSALDQEIKLVSNYPLTFSESDKKIQDEPPGRSNKAEAYNSRRKSARLRTPIEKSSQNSPPKSIRDSETAVKSPSESRTKKLDIVHTTKMTNSNFTLISTSDQTEHDPVNKTDKALVDNTAKKSSHFESPIQTKGNITTFICDQKTEVKSPSKSCEGKNSFNKQKKAEVNETNTSLVGSPAADRLAKLPGLSVSTVSTVIGKSLGCSKCRFNKNGCKTCRSNLGAVNVDKMKGGNESQSVPQKSDTPTGLKSLPMKTRKRKAKSESPVGSQNKKTKLNVSNIADPSRRDENLIREDAGDISEVSQKSKFISQIDTPEKDCQNVTKSETAESKNKSVITNLNQKFDVLKSDNSQSPGQSDNLMKPSEKSKLELQDDYSTDQSRNPNGPLEKDPLSLDDSEKTANVSEGSKGDKTKDKALDTKDNNQSHARPFTCTTCDKKFSRVAGLKKHESLHTTSSSFDCLHCDKSFSRAATLRRHEATHTIDEKLESKTGGKKVQDKLSNPCVSTIDLKKAVITENEKMFSCFLCLAKFVHESDLRSHVAMYRC